MCNRIQKIAKQDGFFIILVFISFLFHLAMKPGGDDIGRISAYSTMSYKDVLIDTWNFLEGQPRYFTYLIVGTLCHLKYGFWIWRVTDCIIIFIILKSISYLFVKNKDLNLLVGILIGMYPFSEMMTAGAISTTVGYTWILSSLLLALVYLKKANCEKLRWYEILLFTLATIYATEQEQICITLLIIFTVWTIFSFYKKNWYSFTLCCVAELLTLCNAFILFYVAFVGGRSNEIIYYPDFGSLSFIDKLEMAFSSTLDRVLFTNSIMLLLTGFILFIIWQRTKSKIYTFLGVVPFTVCFIGSTKPFLFENIHNAINTTISDTVKYGTIHINNYYNISSYFQLFILCMTGGLILLSLFLIGNNLKESLFSVAFIVLGLMTRMMLMFTVNIFASSTRTYLFLWFSIICTTVYIVDNNYVEIIYPYINRRKNLSTFIQIALPVLAVCALINNMLACI